MRVGKKDMVIMYIRIVCVCVHVWFFLANLWVVHSRVSEWVGGFCTCIFALVYLHYIMMMTMTNLFKQHTMQCHEFAYTRHIDKNMASNTKCIYTYTITSSNIKKTTTTHTYTSVNFSISLSISLVFDIFVNSFFFFLCVCIHITHFTTNKHGNNSFSRIQRKTHVYIYIEK